MKQWVHSIKEHMNIVRLYTVTLTTYKIKWCEIVGHYQQSNVDVITELR